LFRPIEVGSSLTLGITAPVDCYGDGRGAPNRISFQVPEISIETLPAC
jgi:hypothetical protein